MFFLSRMLDNKLRLPEPSCALPGRGKPIATARSHHVFKRPLKGPFAPGVAQAVFAMGCFWGAEQLFWRTPGVVMTAAGFAGGFTPNPTHQEVCTGLTGHAEAVLVTYDPVAVAFGDLLGIFWESHDPTQGMQQGADIGTAYRSLIRVFTDDQRRLAESSRAQFQAGLDKAGLGRITTEIEAAGVFYYAEAEHQQYLSKNPGGACGQKPTGVILGAPHGA